MLNHYLCSSFRIEVIVDDGDDSATFVIFDQDCSKLTGTTAEDVRII